MALKLGRDHGEPQAHMHTNRLIHIHKEHSVYTRTLIHTRTHTHTNKQSLYNTALKKCGCKKGMWRKGGYYIIQYERGKDNGQSLQETHFSFLQSSQLYLI